MTERQLKVAHLIATGCSIDDVAARLDMRHCSVKRHLVSLYRKYGLETCPRLVGFDSTLAGDQGNEPVH
jgi:DNA-binding NarL/FixJ family response regulator